MDTWEYGILAIVTGTEIAVQEMNILGGKGWELTCSYGENKLVFKRKVQAQAQEDDKDRTQKTYL